MAVKLETAQTVGVTSKMATKICIVFSALLCIASCGPLGEVLLNPMGSTTVCDSSPNLFGLGLPLPPLGVGSSTTVCESSPNLGLGLGVGYPFGLGYPGHLPGLGISASPNLGSTTVCESVPNVPSLPNLAIPASYPYSYPYSYPLAGLGMGSATVCETSPNLVGINGYGYGLNPYLPGVVGGIGSTTVCDSSPNGIGLGHPFARGLSPYGYLSPFL